jgi:YVTN family beta-propeller protein
MRCVRIILALVVSLNLIGCASRDFATGSVGPITEDKFVLPVSQILTPAGQQVSLPGMRPQALALSPDGLLLVTSGKTNHLIVLDPSSGRVIQTVPFLAGEPATSGSSHTLAPDTKAQLSFTGLVFSPDGKRIYMSDVNGSVKVFEMTNRTVRALHSFSLPESGLPRRKKDIPSGLAVSPDGRRIYVVLNLSNRLLEIDAATGKSLRSFDVGVAPYDVRLAGKKAYVSNWGGRRPDTDSLTGPAGRGTVVRVDPQRHIANEGSISIIDLQSGQVKEVLAGLHASGLAIGRHYLAVANAASDSVTVLDLRNDRVIETISLKWQPRDYFGASPNALAFDPSGNTLYVCNGTQNAIACVDFRPGNSRLRGLIPVAWFPGAIIYDDLRKKLYVANIKGTGSGRRTLQADSLDSKLNSHQYVGTLSIVPVPTRSELITHTRQVLANCRREIIEASQLPARPNQPPRPVPQRVGEPSVFKHVVYIIKENRTYDQVLGDMAEGNGASNLCVFGEYITPNQHKIARDFVLLDNTYCSGILSADGHQWSTTAFATDYLERSFAGFPRSYPDGMEDDDVDALAYAPSGFIWDNAIEHGKSLRVFGEFAIGATGWKDPNRNPAPKFLDFYRDFTEGTSNTFVSSRPAIESLRPYMNTNTLGWGMEVPDVFRAAQFIKELNAAEQSGDLPNLTIICLPNNHTSGTKAGFPTPAASVADNDLAFGQIVEAISRSKFWNETCIFAIEDDPQDGWDHVSGYRTTAYVISPYTKRGKVISTQYNQPGMLRTIELILGLPPMNQMDAAATPMSDCFVDAPDFTPFTALTNNIPLDQMNPPARAHRDPKMRYFAEVSARLPLHKIDACPEELLNRIIWHTQKGAAIPFPKWATSQDRD